LNIQQGGGGAVGGDLTSPSSPFGRVCCPSTLVYFLPLADVTFTLATMLGGIIKEANFLPPVLLPFALMVYGKCILSFEPPGQ